MRRRTFLSAVLAGGAALLTGRSVARAIGDKARFRFGHLRIGDEGWNPRPNALRRMAWEIEKRTSIDIDLEPAEVDLDSDDLHRTPFLYLAGDRELPLPDDASIKRLRAFLTFGGFLLIDSAEGRTDGAFDKSVRALMRAVFPPPAESLQIIPGDHVLYKSFYLLERPVGRIATSPVMDGVIRDDRLVVAYVQNDLGGAWSRDNFGNYEYECVPGGSRQRELAFRLGVNAVMYALCLDYKTDQVHVPFIMRRRRWRTGDAPQPPPGLPR
jgi:hypothetical protein